MESVKSLLQQAKEIVVEKPRLHQEYVANIEEMELVIAYIRGDILSKQFIAVARITNAETHSYTARVLRSGIKQGKVVLKYD